ncbi:MAG: HDIG domain-containing protein, partial [Bacteroidales bacterium]|nr:HDIG domain-containing protein [Bacteroidales bacterium]MBO4446982.1 HDIG domain-containing protein [Bacteroidales bacterium]
NLVSNSRLRDLADTANPLLRELELKAPGTFHHSLQVMNMSEAAARAIGANPLLVKAGAMYHDIGKMTNPQCFVENESLVSKAEDQKYHYGLSYKQSSKDIIRHVPDGVELARKHGLPQVILEFIITHHGTTVTRYFYDKYVSEGGNPADREDFTYPGVPPTTKEQVILMLCDTIEAASRTLKPSSPEDYSLLVDELVQAKMDEGQFTDSEISIKDMETVKEVIKSYLVHLYHERIAYPKDKNNIKK